jgi:hypothetical protein
MFYEIIKDSGSKVMKLSKHEALCCQDINSSFPLCCCCYTFFTLYPLLSSLLLCWGYTVAITKVLIIYQIYHTWIYPLHQSPSSPSSPHPGIVSTDIIFPFIYVNIQYLHHIHLPSLFPHFFPTPTRTNPPRQHLFHPPVLWFCERKKKKR